MCNCDDNINSTEVSSGPQGPTGPQGPAGTITVGTVTTGAAGSSVAITNSGTSTAATLNFTIPKGDKGDTGNDGPTGSTGKNAYTTVSGSSSIGADTYLINCVSTSWMGLDQILYIEGSGYYKVLILNTNTTITVLDLLYTGNTPIFTPGSLISPGGVKGADGYSYETIDGNGIPATGNGAYSILIRNSSDTGYEFITAVDLKAYLATLP